MEDKRINCSDVNNKIKKFKKGLDEKFVFVTPEGETFLLSTVDVLHRDYDTDKDNWIWRYETMLFKNPIIDSEGYIVEIGDEVWCNRYHSKEKAIETHNDLVKQIQEGVPYEKVFGI